MTRPTAVKTTAMVVAATALLMSAGCAPPGAVPPMPVDKIDAMTLVALTLPLRVAEQKEPAGVQMQIFFYTTNPAGQPESATISGNLEMIMFEDAISPEDMSATRPFRTWTFTPQQLSGLLRKSMGLWCYHLPLEWGSNLPASNVVTVIARYVPQGRPPMYSSPATIVP
ncbi:MAG: hypothetical protein HZA50_02320 [Planctomycetes bacterium]|nr:hypothetical protein [Planctomycetota bacterium]